MPTSAYHLLVLSGILWGLNPVIFKFALVYATVMMLVMARFLLGAATMYVLHNTSFRRLDRRELGLATAVGLFTALGVTLYVFALQITSALHASLIAITLPFTLYFIIGVVLKETIHRRVIWGSILASLGLTLIIFYTARNANSEASLIGDLMLFLSQVSTAIGVVAGRKLLGGSRPISPEQLVFLEYLIAGIVVAVVAAAGLQTVELAYSPAALFWIAAVVTIGGIVPMLLYWRAIEHLPGERISDNNFISPIVGFIAAAVFLGETITPYFVIGSAIIFVGLLISNNKLHPIVIGAHIKNMPKSFVHRLTYLAQQAIHGEQLFSRRLQALGRRALHDIDASFHR